MPGNFKGVSAAFHPHDILPFRRILRFPVTVPFDAARGKILQLVLVDKLRNLLQDIVDGLMRQGTDGDSQRAAGFAGLLYQGDQNPSQQVRFPGSRRPLDHAQAILKGQGQSALLGLVQA